MPDTDTKSPDLPPWFDGKKINEGVFCKHYMAEKRLLCVDGTFFTPKGRMADETDLKQDIYSKLEPYVTSGLARKADSLVEALRLAAYIREYKPMDDKVFLENGALFLDGTFRADTDHIPVLSRFPVRYNPDAPWPQKWQDFLHELLEPEDIMTLQEFIGYCFLPTNKAQKMMIIKGNGGEGKSVVGAVLTHLFGVNAKDGSIGKISENPFARADLEHIHLLIDDDMRMDALKQTNYVKSLVTAQGKVDLEKKGKQSYQGYVYARLLAFSNGNLKALYDRSDGFYRRQLILTCLDRRRSRRDDPNLASKLIAEKEGIFLWAWDGLKRLHLNGYRFTESDKARKNRLMAQAENNNVISFLRSQGYIRFDPEYSLSVREAYAVYRFWCEENAIAPLSSRSFSDYLQSNMTALGLKFDYHCMNAAGRRVRGYKGMAATLSLGDIKPHLRASPDAEKRGE